MKTLVKVNVTQKHIKMGIPNEGASCPIACALQELYPDAEIDVEGTRVIVTPPTPAQMTFTLAGNARKFIDRFDDGKSVKPLKVVLRPEV